MEPEQPPRPEGHSVTEYSPTDLATQLKSGLLSFPVTDFADDLERANAI